MSYLYPFICGTFSVNIASGTHGTVQVCHTYGICLCKTTRTIRVSIGLYVHVGFGDFTIVPPLTEGYEKIFTIIVFDVATVLPREEHEQKCWWRVCTQGKPKICTEDLKSKEPVLALACGRMRSPSTPYSSWRLASTIRDREELAAAHHIHHCTATVWVDVEEATSGLKKIYYYYDVLALVIDMQWNIIRSCKLCVVMKWYNR
jgi:hypothetical protein